MNLEIEYGGKTYYQTHMGNLYQGCLLTLDDFVQDNPGQDIPVSPFIVTNLSVDCGEPEIIGLEEVLSIKILANLDNMIEIMEPFETLKT